MKKYNLLVEIKIDDERIEDLYPDFEIYFDSIKDFMDNLYAEMETADPKSLDRLGYSVKVKQNAAILPITFSQS